MAVRMKRGLALFLGAVLLFSAASAQTFAAGTDGQYALVSDAGEIICPVGEYEQIIGVTDSIFAAKTDEGWVLLDENGERVTDAAYEDVYAQGGYLLLKKDGLYAAADDKAQLVTEHLYTQIVPNGEGGFLALKTEPMDDRGDGVYLIAPDGSETASGTVIVYGLSPFSCARSAAVSSGGKRTGYLAPDGTWAITAQYGHGSLFTEEGLAVAAADSGVGVIDTEGNWVVSPKFEQICLTPGNRIAAVRTGSGRIGLMDTATREKIAEPEGENGYASTRALRDMALVTMNGMCTLYASDGSVLNEWSEDTGAAVCMMGDENLLLSIEGGEYLLDLSAQILAGPYRRIEKAGEGVFAAHRSGGGCDLIGTQGELFAETQFCDILPVGGEIMLANGCGGLALINKEGSVLVEMTRNEGAD